MKAVVDTDILSELLRKKNTSVRARAAAYLKQHRAISISAMTVFEIAHGWYTMGRVDKVAEYLARVAAFKVLPFDSEVAKLAGRIGGRVEGWTSASPTSASRRPPCTMPACS